MTGLRRGELCGLRWSDLDLDASMLHVRQTIVTVAGVLELSDVKSAHSRRRVLDLDAGTVATLRRHRVAQLELRMLVSGRAGAGSSTVAWCSPTHLDGLASRQHHQHRATFGRRVRVTENHIARFAPYACHSPARRRHRQTPKPCQPGPGTPRPPSRSTGMGIVQAEAARATRSRRCGRPGRWCAVKSPYQTPTDQARKSPASLSKSALGQEGAPPRDSDPEPED